MQKQFNKKDLFHTAGAAKSISGTYTAGDEFLMGPQCELVLKIVIGGTVAPNSINLKFEVSYDKTNWETINAIDTPLNGFINTVSGTVLTHEYAILLQEDCKYRISVLATGGTAPTALITGSSRRPYGIRLANRESFPSSAYDSSTGSDKVTVINPVTSPVPVRGTVGNGSVDDASFSNKMGAVAVDVLSTVASGSKVDIITDLLRRLRVVDASYSSLQDANAVISRNGPETQNMYQRVANELNKANGTYPYYVNMTGYKSLNLRLLLTGVITVKFYGSIENVGVVPGSITDWPDITNDAWGVASFTASNVLSDTANYFAAFNWVKIEVVTAGGGTDDYIIDVKKLF